MSVQNKTLFSVLGVFRYKKTTHLFVRQKGSRFLFSLKKELPNGSFALVEEKSTISISGNEEEEVSLCRDFRFCDISEGKKKRFALTYLSLASGIPELHIATSYDMKLWRRVSVLSHIHSPSSLAFFPSAPKDKYVLYHGKVALSVSSSEDLEFFETRGVSSLLSALNTRNTLRIAGIKSIPEGILVLYFAYSETSQYIAKNCAVYGMLFDVKYPGRVVWQSENPLWTVPDREVLLRDPISMIFIDETHITSYWSGSDNALYAFRHWIGATKKKIEKKKEEEVSVEKESLQPQMTRHIANPILEPKNEHAWETKAAFNPTALCDDDGNVHIVYRAIGEGDVSVLGYALSRDGFSIDERVKVPMYVPRTIHEGLPNDYRNREPSTYSPYESGGGGWGGCEDPKLTRIEDTLYMTYVAYNGWAPPRVALTSISMENFLARKWGKWTHPVLISPPGKVAKSAAILPEKVNGKYVVFYRIFPDVLVDFVDSLDEFDEEKVFLKDLHRISPREGAWDAGKFSFGAAPLRTKEGWLVIYHAVTGRQEWQGSDLRYKIGAMLLDLEHPERVICRSSKAILEPDLHYENSGWKAGIVYPCGAVIRNGELLVYYGGADTVTCVASAPLDEFLHTLLASGDPELHIVKE